MKEPLAVASPAVSDHSHFLQVKAITSLAIKRGITARSGVQIIQVVIRLVVLDLIVAFEMGTALVVSTIEDLLVEEMLLMELNLTKNRDWDPLKRCALIKTAILVVNITTKDLCREIQHLEVVMPIVLASSNEGVRGWVDLASPNTGHPLTVLSFPFLSPFPTPIRDYFSFILPKNVPLCR